MYADDTTLVSHFENFGPMNDINTLKQELNREISKVNTWLLSNKLLLNVAKSKFIIFFKHPRTIPKLSISINGNPVEQVTNFDFLGITLDQNITWNDHISKISIKVARVIGIMNKLKHIFPHHLWIIYLGIFSETINNTTKESCKNISPKTIHITYHLYLQRFENS